MHLSTLIAKLHAVFEENRKPTNLTGKAEARANARLAQREDDAYAAIARFQANTIADFYPKLLVTLEANELVSRPGGFWGGAGTKEAQALVRSIMRDAELLFVGKEDDRLLELIQERRAIVAEILAHNAIGDRIYGAADARFPGYAKARDRAQHPDCAAYTAMLEELGEPAWEAKTQELFDRKGRNEDGMARCKVRSIRAVMELTTIIALGVNTEDMSIASDRNYERITKNMGEFAGMGSAVVVEPESIKAAA